MPRIRTKPVTWKLTIDETLAARVELTLANLSAGRPQYGARSALISALLRQWLQPSDPLVVPGPQDPNLIAALEETTHE